MPLLAHHSRTATEFPKLAELIAYLDGLQGRADLATLRDILTRLDISREDILPACVFGQKGYRRNTICRSDWYELLANCWHSGHCTPIHDHRGVSCAFCGIQFFALAFAKTRSRYLSQPSSNLPLYLSAHSFIT